MGDPALAAAREEAGRRLILAAIGRPVGFDRMKGKTLTERPIRTGIIGLNPKGHWAALAHLPALAALKADFTVAGVANTSLESARRAAAAFDIAHAFDSPQALVESPEIELVVVTVKVPYHHELVMAALQQGKHVLCEWPLGNGLAEAREMAALASAKGVVAVCDTQMRVSPEVAYIRQLIADGYVGRVLSTTLIGSGGAQGGAEIGEAVAYVADKANGVTVLTVPLAHTLAGVQEVLGRIHGLSARIANRWPMVRITESGETIPKTADDQILLHGLLADDVPISVHYRGGTCRGTNLLWEINGSEGDIQMTAPIGGGQMARLTLQGARGKDSLAPLVVPDNFHEGWPDNPMVSNVGRVYARMAKDIRTGSRSAPSFADAVVLHELIDSIEQSAAITERG